jgi:hypothetical protein
MSSSCFPMSAIRQVYTLVKNLSLMKLPNTRIDRHPDKKRKGKGTMEPGAGTQAVFY